jgi:hypothetical protein
MHYQMLICKFCNKECKSNNSLINHERLCKKNPDRQKSPFESKEIQSSRKKSNQFIKGTNQPRSKESLTKQKVKSDLYWSAEKRSEWSLRMKIQAKKNIENHPESYSYKNFCGRAKKSLYKDEWMHSSWELIVAMWLDKKNIKWTKRVRYFEYEWNGTVRKYFPDFYLEDLDVYIEVKGYETDRDTQKWKSVNNLIILKDKEIKAIKEDRFTFGQVP